MKENDFESKNYGSTLKETAKDVKEKAVKKAEEIGENISSEAKKNEQNMEDTIKEVKSKTTEAYNATLEYMQKNPIASFVLALLTGAVIGAVIKK